MVKIHFVGLKDSHVVRPHGYNELITNVQVMTITGVVYL